LHSSRGNSFTVETPLLDALLEQVCASPIVVPGRILRGNGNQFRQELGHFFLALLQPGKNGNISGQVGVQIVSHPQKC
jgi:hypothetical protein